MALAAVELQDAAERLRGGSGEAAPAGPSSEQIREALRLISDVLTRLRDQSGGALGIPVEAAADYLQVSAPTVRSWLARGVLEEMAGSRPKQVDPASLRLVGHAVVELRARGQDRDWLRSLVDLLHDRAHVGGEGVARGLEEFARGELEPA